MSAADRDTGAPAAAPPSQPHRVASRLARAFGDSIGRLHARMAGEPGSQAALAAWAERVWQAADEGHVCVEVESPDERALLSASPVVANGADVERERSVQQTEGDSPATVLVLDRDCLYLRRLFRAESRLADAVVALDEEAPVADAAAIDATLSVLFPGAGSGDPQRQAVQAGLTRRLVLVSGGPGTGKTTTLARLLVAFVRLRPDARVCFAAPTGKAAARLAQSLAAQMPVLDPGAALAERLPGTGLTVHRLLGLRGEAPGDLERAVPLPWDLVIVDEASMLDVELASALALAIPARARLVLAGDADQLASVEAGAVFAELCASGSGAIVRLERNYRQEGAARIVALAAAIRDRIPEAQIVERLGPLTQRADSVAQVVDEALAAYDEALSAIERREAAGPVLAAFERFRVLCAMREGDRGTVELNRAIGARVRRRMQAPAQAAWYAGRLVMVTRNLPDWGLVNGDVGVCLTPARVSFAGIGGVREIPVLSMPACEDAFAITVHKAQGSEFDAIAFVPAPPGHPLNTRELVYTAITRGRTAVRIWGEASTVAAAAHRRSARDGRLRERIVSATRAPPPAG